MGTINTDYLLNLKGLTVRTKNIAEKEKNGSKLKALKDTLHEQVKAMYETKMKEVFGEDWKVVADKELVI